MVKYFAKTNYRNENKLFGIKERDWQYHCAIIGSTGSGKTNVMTSFMLNDLEFNRGFCLIDPHNDLALKIIESIPKHRKKDVLFVNLSDPEHNHGFNILKKTSFYKRGLIASAVLDIFERFNSANAWGPKISFLLLNCLSALLDYPKPVNLSDVLRILQDKDFRNDCVGHIQNEEVKRFFTKQFKEFNPKYDFLPLYNKFRFLLHPSLRKLLVQNEDSISLRRIMDESKILIISCPIGSIGRDASTLIGSLFLSALTAAAHSRVDIKEDQRQPFTIYCDESQLFALNSSTSIASMLEELRKMKVSTCLCFQGLSSLNQEVRERVFSNVHNIISFRTSAADGMFLAREMAKQHQPFRYEDFVTMPRYHCIVRMVIDGNVCRPFTATSIMYSEIQHGGAIS
ncbi:MAG: DUF87 domain-containing protein [Bacteroidota bacterium]